MKKTKIIAIAITIIITLNTFIPTIVLATNEIEENSENSNITNEDINKNENKIEEENEIVDNQENKEDNTDKDVDQEDKNQEDTTWENNFEGIEGNINNTNKDNDNKEENIQEDINKDVDKTQSDEELVNANSVNNENSETSLSVSYRSHVEDIGWQDYVQDGAISGTSGKSLRLEAINLQMINNPYENAHIKYNVHVQDIGWQGWKKDGEMAGTSGKSLRLEAIKIDIEGMEEYSIIYRTHIQDLGWTEWSSNGEISGTTGQSKRLEAIQIKLIKGKYEKFKLSITNGQNVINDYKKNNKHYLFITKNMDISNLKINYKGNIIASSFGTLNNVEKTIVGDFSNIEDFKITLITGDTENISIIQSDVPAMFVDLHNNVTQSTINSGSKDIKYKASLKITGADNEKHNISDDNIEIKGRGNTTWVMPKKPYQIKFSKKQNPFDIGKDKSKKWVLLANYYDPTLLKNKIMDDLCTNSELSNIPNSKFIDLYINGDYVGNYLLCDKIEIGNGRVELNNDKGVLVELDNAYYNDEEYNFQSKYTGNHFTIKEFKNDDFDSIQKNSIMNSFKNSLENFERKLYSENSSWSEISQLIDVNSFAKFYLLNEFSKNLDTYFSSTYLYKDGENDVIHMGPLWDYDKDSFAGDTHCDYSTNLFNFMNRLYKFPEFAKIVDEIYEREIKQNFDKINVKQYADSIKKSSRINSIIWYSENKYNENLEKLNNWIEKRKEYYNLRYTNVSPSVYYSTHIEDYGWENAKRSKEISGTTGQSKRLEAIRILATDCDNNILPIEYQTHIENIGWQNWKTGSNLAGTTGQALRLEAIRIKLKDSSEYSIRYRVHVQDIGWQDWKADGEMAGTEGQSKRLEAIQIEIVKK